MEKQRIQIFVSRRRDLNSVMIPNKIYINVDCGAIYHSKRNWKVRSDNEGTNISYKAPTFSELTVQYWAWKNFDLDYYGLCHYRRYLSFSDLRWPIDNRGHVVIEKLSDKTASLFGLMDKKKMEETISDYDIVYSERIPVNIIETEDGKKDSVYDMWMSNDKLIPNKVFQRLLELINELAPSYSNSLYSYMHSGYHIGYCCYVMKSDLFKELCNLQFPILEQLESEVNLTQYDGLRKRCIAFAGEIIYGMFIYHQHLMGKKCKEVQLVFFNNTADSNYIIKLRDYLRHISRQLDSIASSLKKIEEYYEELLDVVDEKSDKDGSNKKESNSNCCENGVDWRNKEY